MKVYDQKHIKNVVLLGAPKSGKTQLAEDMLFEAGLVHRRGTNEERNTTSDYHEIEIERGHSVFATPLHTEWHDYKINIIDTPGFDDFAGEMISSIRIADTCIAVINAQHGLELSSEKLWGYIEKYNKPTIIAINQLDHPKANFDSALTSLTDFLGNAVTQIQYPVNQREGFNSIIDLLKMIMYRFPTDGGKPEKLPIPDSEIEEAKMLHNALVEKAAENDEQLMEKFFEKGTLDEDEMRMGLKIGMVNRQIYPVFCMSAKKNMGSGRLMGFIDNVAPSPLDTLPEITTSGRELPQRTGQPPVLFIYKSHFEINVGKISYFKVMSGEVTNGIELINSETGATERLHQLFIIDGKNRTPVDRLIAGDIGAALKLKDTSTNQTLRSKELDIAIVPTDFPEPCYRMAVIPSTKGDDDKIGEALNKLHQEDPSLHVAYSKELKQLIISGQGEMHLSVCQWYLQNVYHINAEFQTPKVPYRETIRKSAAAYYRHKKQSGGAGQFAEVHLKVAPYYEGHSEPDEFPVKSKEVIDLDWGGKLVFYNCISGGVIDSRFIPSILKGIMEKMEEGPISGSYVRDVQVILFDGKMHPVDSNDIAFKIAGAMAFKQAFMQADPQLLEPLYDVQIFVPQEMVGETISDLQSKRALIMGIDTQNNYQVIQAKVPLAELNQYATTLKSLTHGRAMFTSSFADYAVVSSDIQRKLTEYLHGSAVLN